MTHTLSFWCSFPSNKCCDRLCYIFFDKLGGFNFGITTNFTNHNNAFSFWVLLKLTQNVDKISTDDRVATDSNTGCLTNACFVHTTDPRSTFDVSEQERLAFWEELYAGQGFGIWQGNFRDMLTDREANAAVSDFVGWVASRFANCSSIRAANSAGSPGFPVKTTPRSGFPRKSLNNSPTTFR